MVAKKSTDEPSEQQINTEADLPEIDPDSIGTAADQTRELSEEEAQETNVVRYVGTFSERRITREEWEQAGVPDQEGVTWTKDAPSIPIEDFTEDALRVLGSTGEFQVVRDQ